MTTLTLMALLILAPQVENPGFAQTSGGSRPGYVYDTAGVLSDEYWYQIDSYLRAIDDKTTAEIVVITLPSFVGHGIEKDGIEIQDSDMLANYIFNEVSLEGVKGIGKIGKDNGVLVLLSLERDASGAALRIEVGRGLEGDITDGTAGEILDAYLVPALQEYESTGDTYLFDEALLYTAIELGILSGYVSEDGEVQTPPEPETPFLGEYLWLFILASVFFGAIPVYLLSLRRGGFGGGGGSSGGGGAGR